MNGSETVLSKVEPLEYCATLIALGAADRLGPPAEELVVLAGVEGDVGAADRHW